MGRFVDACYLKPATSEALSALWQQSLSTKTEFNFFPLSLKTSKNFL